MDLFEKQSCEFISRHIGPDEHSTKQMLKTIGVPDLDTLISRTVPPAIRMQHELNLPAAMSEHQYLAEIKKGLLPKTRSLKIISARDIMAPSFPA